MQIRYYLITNLFFFLETSKTRFINHCFKWRALPYAVSSLYTESTTPSFFNVWKHHNNAKQHERYRSSFKRHFVSKWMNTQGCGIPKGKANDPLIRASWICTQKHCTNRCYDSHTHTHVRIQHAGVGTTKDGGSLSVYLTWANGEKVRTPPLVPSTHRIDSNTYGSRERDWWDDVWWGRCAAVSSIPVQSPPQSKRKWVNDDGWCEAELS